eukprot:525803-Prymnesium_polylepis.1
MTQEELPRLVLRRAAIADTQPGGSVVHERRADVDDRPVCWVDAPMASSSRTNSWPPGCANVLGGHGRLTSSGMSTSARVSVSSVVPCFASATRQPRRVTPCPSFIHTDAKRAITAPPARMHVQTPKHQREEPHAAEKLARLDAHTAHSSQPARRSASPPQPPLRLRTLRLGFSTHNLDSPQQRTSALSPPHIPVFAHFAKAKRKVPEPLAHGTAPAASPDCTLATCTRADQTVLCPRWSGAFGPLSWLAATSPSCCRAAKGRSAQVAEEAREQLPLAHAARVQRRHECIHRALSVRHAAHRLPSSRVARAAATAAAATTAAAPPLFGVGRAADGCVCLQPETRAPPRAALALAC